MLQSIPQRGGRNWRLPLPVTPCPVPTPAVFGRAGVCAVAMCAVPCSAVPVAGSHTVTGGSRAALTCVDPSIMQRVRLSLGNGRRLVWRRDADSLRGRGGGPGPALGAGDS